MRQKLLHRVHIRRPRMHQPRRRWARRIRGFSLVEVCLAIGVVAFAILSLLALLPGGLMTFRRAMETSITAQIVQRVVSDAEQTDFDALRAGAVKTTDGFFRLPDRFFDDQGTEVVPHTPADEERIVYTVRVRGSVPGVRDQAKHTAQFFTSLPGTEYPQVRYNPRNLTFLAIQVANNPRRRAVDADANNPLLWTTSTGEGGAVPVLTYSAALARNGFGGNLRAATGGER